MLQDIKTLYGSKIAAIDGDIGHVKDFYFDDKTWVIRYLVVDTGSWLAERAVLLSPHAFGKWDQFEGALHIKLTKRQIEGSPSIDAHTPVSRNFEIDYYRYYGWPAYWTGSSLWGTSGYPMVVNSPDAAAAADGVRHQGVRHPRKRRRDRPCGRIPRQRPQLGDPQRGRRRRRLDLLQGDPDRSRERRSDQLRGLDGVCKAVQGGHRADLRPRAGEDKHLNVAGRKNSRGFRPGCFQLV